MGCVTITILQGADRGRVYRDLETPVTIGREEGNTIQLNDERVSRCHLKIQQDGERVVLTDLDSTNGTKVNGQECQLRILRFGDIVTVGRSLMRIGTEAEIAERMAMLRPSSDGERTRARDVTSATEGAADFDFEINGQAGDPSVGLMGLIEPPDIPENLTPGQAAQLCEILEYLQGRLNPLIDGAIVNEDEHKVVLPFENWQRLLDAQARLAMLVRRVVDPDWQD